MIFKLNKERRRICSVIHRKQASPNAQVEMNKRNNTHAVLYNVITYSMGYTYRTYTNRMSVTLSLSFYFRNWRFRFQDKSKKRFLCKHLGHFSNQDTANIANFVNVTLLL